MFVDYFFVMTRGTKIAVWIGYLEATLRNPAEQEIEHQI